MGLVLDGDSGPHGSPGHSPPAVALMDWTAPQVLIPIKLLASLIKRKCCHGTPADSGEGGGEEGERRGVVRGRSEVAGEERENG